MSKDLLNDLSKTVRQVSEQLNFYREIGVADLAGSRSGDRESDCSGSAGSTQAEDDRYPSLPTQRVDDSQAEVATQAPSFEQTDLFGEAPIRIQPGRIAPILSAPSDQSLESIREDIGDCMRCKLCHHRTNIVFGEGSPNADLMFIGEGPGADEDATGRPFVGRAGQLLDKIISSIGLRREEVYIANVVKCRPPGNRTPERDEVATCEPFLFRQIAVIRPKIIVTLGSPAFQSVLKSRESVTRIRGEWRELGGIAVMPTFHPAYLLRSPDKKREVWEDMKKVRQRLDEIRPRC